MVLRGLMLRVMYHRAAVSVQMKYRNRRNRGNKANQVGPAIQIQRFWRGLRAGLRCMRMIDAGKLIWQNYTIYRWNKRSALYIRSILRAQRYWRGALSRQWVRHCHDAATFIQKYVRRLLIRVVLDRPGYAIVRKHQKQLNDLLKSKDTRSETEQLARCAAVAAHAKVQMEKHRNRNVDMRRALSFNLRSKHTRQGDRAKMMRNVGRTQPQRESVFEPLVFGMARQQPDRLPARNGCVQSKVLKQVMNSKRLLDKSLPAEAKEEDFRQSWFCPFRVVDPNTGVAGEVCHQANPLGMRNCSSCKKRQYTIPHAATVRGRSAVIAMRFAKNPKMPNAKTPLLNLENCMAWGTNMFQPKGF